jgi:hypothetical protein
VVKRFGLMLPAIVSCVSACQLITASLPDQYGLRPRLQGGAHRSLTPFLVP